MTSDGAAKRRQLPVWQETILLLGIALVLAVVLKALFVQAFYIPSESMEPGLVANDRILVQKVSYWGDDGPERGDVVVFEDPDDWLDAGDAPGPTSLLTRGLAKVGMYPTGGHLVKRVIGVGGDTVTCCDQRGRLSINGHTLDESGYVMQDGTRCAAPMSTQGRCRLNVTVPDGHLFLMGDNRGRSSDSSAHVCGRSEDGCAPDQGFVSVDLVVGKVFVLIWPASRFDRLSRPDVFEDVPDPE